MTELTKIGRATKQVNCKSRHLFATVLPHFNSLAPKGFVNNPLKTKENKAKTKENKAKTKGNKRYFSRERVKNSLFPFLWQQDTIVVKTNKILRICR